MVLKNGALKSFCAVKFNCGCGTGEVLKWLAEKIAPGGAALGLDLARAHVAAAADYFYRNRLVACLLCKTSIKVAGAPATKISEKKTPGK